MTTHTKPLIVVSSRTGNTMTLAHAICDALPGATLCNCQQLPDDLSTFNPVLLGFWCDKMDAPDEMKEVAKQLHHKTIGCFCTMGGDPNTPEHQSWMQEASERLVRLGQGNTLKETFLCQGRIAQDVFDRMTEMLGGVSSARQETFLKSETHPNRLDIAEAADVFRAAFGMNW